MIMGEEYTIYLDDGGHPKSEDVVLVAGWASTLDEWLAFERGWKRTLTEFGINPPIFHMTDFESPYGAYGQWPERNKGLLLGELISHIRAQVRSSFCSVVPMNDYKLVNNIVCLEELLGKPYALAGRNVASQINRWKARNEIHDAPVVIIFEDGSTHKGDLMEVFKKDGFDDPAFRKKKDIVSLQAADLLAWECFNSFKTGDVRASFDRLLAVDPDAEHDIYTADDLYARCNEAKAPLRDNSVTQQFVFDSSPKRTRKRDIAGLPKLNGIWGSTRTLKIAFYRIYESGKPVGDKQYASLKEAASVWKKSPRRRQVVGEDAFGHVARRYTAEECRFAFKS